METEQVDATPLALPCGPFVDPSAGDYRNPAMLTVWPVLERNI